MRASTHARYLTRSKRRQVAAWRMFEVMLRPLLFSCSFSLSAMI